MRDLQICFCIPTYNRSKSLLRNVRNILTINDDVRVVVLDNGSSDNTLEMLEEITDPRLIVHTNGENKGALYNMVNVLDKGVGDYLVYMTDQDHIDTSLYDNFKSFLIENRDISCGYCNLIPQSTLVNKVFKNGYDSVNAIAYKCLHPTGHFFNNVALRKLDIVNKYSDYDFVGLFPLEFIFADLCSNGFGAIYNNRLFIPETGDSVAEIKSSTTNGKLKDAFFTPSSRLKIAISFAKHALQLNFDNNVKKKIVTDVFYSSYYLATREYRSIMLNSKICNHYYMDPVKLGTLTVLNNGYKFFKGFFMGASDYIRMGGLAVYEIKVIVVVKVIKMFFARRFKFLKKQ